MEPQVFINIKDIQKCNNNIVKRLKSLNDCTKSTCQQCPLDIARIAKDVADLETRMETLTAHTDDTNESDIARRFDDIKSQLDDIQRLLHFPDANHESKNVTRIIRQHKKYYIPGREDTWRAVADKSQERALPNTVRSRFITMVLCLDISESMSSNNGWGQTLEFVNDFLTELKELKTNDERLLDEYIAVTTFGHETKLQTALTNNYDEIRETIQGLILGGPSPLYGGLLISMATAHIAKRRYVPNINGLNLSPRIIVITDGCPTDTMLHAGPDIQDESKVEQTESHLAEAVEEIDKRDFELFFIGVGKCRKTFIQNMSTLCQSKIYSYKDGRRLARFGFFESQLATHGLALTFSLTNRLSVWDEDDIKFIRADTKRRCERQYGPLCQESNDASLLSLGTRVRRGLAWNDGNFDLNGPGTVTGHFDGKLLVTWDLNDHTSSYRYTRECCEVQAVDEPRVLNPAERMETGCKVKPGGDCVSREIGNSNRGVVLRVETPHATIRWDNGHIGKYCYGVDTKIEIELEQMSTPEGV
ncbi:uncharacterized protein LOC127854026 isoform X1 [Dreissena polymorpha]|uniref:VWFA domain-containing protein n=1 Tax=Dreissena polymorpha TaxID=45954 RepID=A0A9D4CI25_DREPO|nr:uncharacterized protein LOC127854026 isoform X1 [Dreissena polymorpha]KAH3725718.1 hypothetical protein DPMN_051567 [Dreissena polymorpha]